MRAPGFNVTLTVPATEPAERRDFVRDAVPPFLRSLSCRRPWRHVRQWRAERQFLRRLKPHDIAYIWPAVSLATYEAVRARGSMLVMERINCHRATARPILDEAYDRLGWPAAHGISNGDIAEESRKLHLADYVFCPSPFVRQSMLDAGIAADKLLDASYGWDPVRFEGEGRALPAIDGFTALFVGLACVRKGTPLLLKAWARAGIRGRLVLAGEVAPDVASHCADELNRSDVIWLRHCPDVVSVYRTADVFVLPTLEEGSPLVSYEAMACGLPCLTSPMGAGRIIRNGQEGVVLPPYAEEAWIDALRRLARDSELRKLLGRAARRRVADFTWSLVGERRRRQLEAVAVQPVGRGLVACS
jgi:glycosyltransferase involved in cell wall biosynthesis